MKVIILLVLSITLASCGNYFEAKEGAFDFGGFDTVTGESVDFSVVKEKIMAPHCISCHRGYDDYETVKKEVTAIERAINLGTMPKNAPALGNELKGILAAWIRGGLKSGVIVDPVKPVPVYSFENISKKILFPKCVGCHSPDGQASFLDLSTRQVIFDQRDDDFFGVPFLDFNNPDNSYLMQVIVDEEEPMPPRWSGLEQLTEEELELLKGWIKRGLP